MKLSITTNSFTSVVIRNLSKADKWVRQFIKLLSSGKRMYSSVDDSDRSSFAYGESNKLSLNRQNSINLNDSLPFRLIQELVPILQLDLLNLLSAMYCARQLLPCNYMPSKYTM